MGGRRPELENALTLAQEIKHAAPDQPVIIVGQDPANTGNGICHDPTANTAPRR